VLALLMLTAAQGGQVAGTAAATASGVGGSAWLSAAALLLYVGCYQVCLWTEWWFYSNSFRCDRSPLPTTLMFSSSVIAALGTQESCSCVLQDTAQVPPLFDVMFDVPSEPAVG